MPGAANVNNAEKTYDVSLHCGADIESGLDNEKEYLMGFFPQHVLLILLHNNNCKHFDSSVYTVTPLP